MDLWELPVRDKFLWVWSCTASGLICICSLWSEFDIIKTISPITTSKDFTETSPDEYTPQIEILNGCGIPQLAARLTEKSRLLGLDVINEGNSNHFNHHYSLVVHRGGKFENAKYVAKLLGIPHIITQQTTKLFPLADITVIIGKNFERIKLF